MGNISVTLVTSASRLVSKNLKRGAMEMAYFFLPNDAVTAFTKLHLQIWNPADVPRIGLFISNYTPALGDDETTYDALKCTVSGYAQIDLVPGDWVASVSGGVTTYTFPTLIWNFDANADAQTIFGAYIDCDLGADGFHLFGAKLLTASHLIPATASSFSYDLTWSEKTRT